MNLFLDTKLAGHYSSNSQVARILTETWVKDNSYCPSCGCEQLKEFENNRPVADFYCENCDEQFELKSKNGKLTGVINDGAYLTMIQRITSNQNPNFFFLIYSKKWLVTDFFIIPKHFFTSEIIIKRKALSETARRAGWIGCNIDISGIANAGKIFLIKDSKQVNKDFVKESFSRTIFLREKSNQAKGWIIDIMKCIDSISGMNFSLDDIYKFENQLKLKHPQNNFIKDKIRQQLQILRDRGIIEFVGRGRYKKVL